MIEVLVEVDLALRYPVGVHDQVRVNVAVDVDLEDSNINRVLGRAGVEGRLIAEQVAAADRRVVMPVGSRIVAMVV